MAVVAARTATNVNYEADVYKRQVEEHKKLIPPLPANWNGPVVILLKLGIVSWIATQLGTIVIPVINMKISGAVYALVLGVIFTSIGFLDENAINKANSYGTVSYTHLDVYKRQG